jgi:3-hydroxyacyl-CoA dehydrogenase/enoyl-CoA hydratase/3-hydroxybutyryl-CoA epimerase
MVPTSPTDVCMLMFEGLRFNHWKTSQSDDGIVTLSMDREGSSVNAISRTVLNELEQIVERLAIEKPAGVIIHSAKPAGFAVGADIKAFLEYARHDTVLENIEHGQRVYEALAKLPCPTVAAIHGACMGGGTELILACRQRIAVDDEKTKIGLPEVMLGIHPGWGGTARLPRLIGATEAMPIMLTGRALSAKRALNMGVVDRLCRPEELLAEAKHLLRRPQQRPFALRAKAWATNTWLARQILAPVMIKQTAAKVRKEHYPAPFAMIDVWKRGGSSVNQRLKLEARSVAKLSKTSTAQNLIRIFFLQERLKSQGADVDAAIKHVHVVGAGVMGGDIAAWAAFRGFEVTLQDREMKFIQPALDRARAMYEKKLKTPEKIEQATRRLRADVEGNGVASADLAIEAIFENAEAKRELYGKIEPQFQGSQIPRDQYLQHSAGRTAHGARRAAALYRPALLQPGGADAAGRGRTARSARSDDRKTRAGLLQGDRQAACCRERHAGFSGQPHSDALSARSHAPLQRGCARPGSGSRSEEIWHADGSD